MSGLEVIGSVASVLQLAATIYSISKTLYEVGDALSNASSDIKDLAGDLETFSQELELLSTLLDGKSTHYSDQVYRLTAKIIGDCAMICEKINRVLKKLRSRSVWAKMKWLYKEKEIEKLRARLRDLKLSLMIILSHFSILKADRMMDAMGIGSSSLLEGPRNEAAAKETVKDLEKARKKLAGITMDQNQTTVAPSRSTSTQFSWLQESSESTTAASNALSKSSLRASSTALSELDPESPPPTPGPQIPCFAVPSEDFSEVKAIMMNSAAMYSVQSFQTAASRFEYDECDDNSERHHFQEVPINSPFRSETGPRYQGWNEDKTASEPAADLPSKKTPVTGLLNQPTKDCQRSFHRPDLLARHLHRHWSPRSRASSSASESRTPSLKVDLSSMGAYSSGPQEFSDALTPPGFWNFVEPLATSSNFRAINFQGSADSKRTASQAQLPESDLDLAPSCRAESSRMLDLMTTPNSLGSSSQSGIAESYAEGGMNYTTTQQLPLLSISEDNWNTSQSCNNSSCCSSTSSPDHSPESDTSPRMSTPVSARAHLLSIPTSMVDSDSHKTFHHSSNGNMHIAGYSGFDAAEPTSGHLRSEQLSQLWWRASAKLEENDPFLSTALNVAWEAYITMGSMIHKLSRVSLTITLATMSSIKRIHGLMKMIQDVLQSKTGACVWVYLSKALDILCQHTDINQYTDILESLADVVALIARYNVMESMYQQLPGMDLEPDYEDALVSLCTHVLEYLGQVITLSLETGQHASMSEILTQTINKINQADTNCRQFTVTFMDTALDRDIKDVSDEDSDSDSANCEPRGTKRGFEEISVAIVHARSTQAEMSGSASLEFQEMGKRPRV
ncbi:uncharacterized protein LY89DRAFT_673527 [Mollisia scopiformis]|uniref:Azaphilone pigments biosynthesis cluster protein L N-terminal domain-containing protein n=1 Tax=Mollisia scopiformis TaxID=149040 RepID=A0A194WY94_MOLSC|nr:uncharacterized protein LY89DRAFT_673527 [Mollisia scopiformis]KUJ12572.1 hypothetical protein LY89DRAFT_673527 [Mollisia scopiformis]